MSLCQVEINTVGRVCCDSVGKLNASSLVFEGSIDLSQGQQVKVDLSNIHQFALFPGQVNQMKECCLSLCWVASDPFVNAGTQEISSVVTRHGDALLRQYPVWAQRNLIHG